MMTAVLHRRAITFGSDLPPDAQPPAELYGRLTVAGWRAHRRRTGRELRVLVDGEDVTTSCCLAHDRRGAVRIVEQGGGA